MIIPQRSQYGFQFHFGHTYDLNRAVVYNWVDRCIYGVFYFHDYYPGSNLQLNRRFKANQDAYKLCMKLNGNPLPDIIGIDNTP